MQDEANLIEQAKTLDRDALNALISAFWQPVYRFVLYKISEPEEAKEITQETFLRVLRALPKYERTDASFQTYLNRIALNIITDAWRKKQRSPVLTDLADHPQLQSKEELPERQALRKEEQAMIAGVLRELPDDQRRTIEYRIIQGLSVKETAAALHKSEAAVKMLQQRALKNCRTLLIEQGLLVPTLGGECLD